MNKNATRKYKDWKGCYIYKVQPAEKIDDRYSSDRTNSDVELVAKKFDVITVEDYCKWYGLYYLTHDEDDNEILVCFTFGDIIDGTDHYYNPDSIVKFAKVNGLKIDALSYICICKRYIEDADCYNQFIPSCYLPSIIDLAKVIDIDETNYSTYFTLNGFYDSHDYINYSRQTNLLNNPSSK